MIVIFILWLIKEEITVRDARIIAPLSDSFHLTLLQELIPEIKLGIDCITIDGLKSDETLDLIKNYLDFSTPDHAQVISALEVIFQQRLKIREYFIREGLHHCYGDVKKADGALRYLEDYLLESLFQGEEGEMFSVLGSLDKAYVLINPDYESSFSHWHHLKSGDIIMSRSIDYVSAYSAQVGVYESQFSHLSFVYRHDQTDEILILESGGEGGALITKMEHTLDREYARLVLYRPISKLNAAIAAKAIYDLLNDAAVEGRVIPFDFTSTAKPSDALFCSEVILEGFNRIGKESFPDRKTKVKPSLFEFVTTKGFSFAGIDIHSYEIFAPGDSAFDSQLEFIAEYRNPALVRDSRQKDRILHKMFSWIERYGYRVKNHSKIQLKAYFYYYLRRSTYFSKYVEHRLPLNLTPEQMTSFMMLDFIGEILQDALNNEEISIGRAMTLSEMDAFLENYRLNDSQARSADFHRWFSP
jgi:hypothetical protein